MHCKQLIVIPWPLKWACAACGSVRGAPCVVEGYLQRPKLQQHDKPLAPIRRQARLHSHRTSHAYALPSQPMVQQACPRSSSALCSNSTKTSPSPRAVV